MTSNIKELITTGLFFDEKKISDFLFAGDWCFRDNYKLIDQFNPLILSHSIDPNQLNFVNVRIERISGILLSRIAVIYNEYFKLNKSEKYYKVVLGKWLDHYAANIYEKMSIIKKAVELYPGISTKSCGDILTITDDYDEYAITSYYSHEFNFRMYSAIAENITGIKTIKTQIGHQYINGLFDEGQAVRYFRQKMVKIYQNTLLLLNRIFHRKGILVVAPYYPEKALFNSIWFFLKSYGKIVHYKFERTDQSQIATDISLRETFKNQIEMQTSDDFLDIASKLIFSFMPICFLEKFSDLRIEANRLIGKSNKDLIFFSLNGIQSNTLFKYVVAEKESNELWIAQHGWGYGTLINQPAEVYEKSVSNRFFTWGWGDDILPSVKISKKSIFKYNNNSRIVLTFPSLVDYSGIFDGNWIYWHDTKAFINSSNKLIRNLNSSLQDHIYLRMQKHRYLKKFVHLDSNSLDEYPTFHKSLQYAKIHVSNHFGTPFLETLGMNFPTIIVHPFPLSDFLRPAVIEDFELLMSAKILFTDVEKAAEHINTVYYDLDSWWLSDKTQSIVSSCAKKYAFSSENWRKLWIKKLLMD